MRENKIGKKGERKKKEKGKKKERKRKERKGVKKDLLSRGIETVLSHMGHVIGTPTFGDCPSQCSGRIHIIKISRPLKKGKKQIDKK